MFLFSMEQASAIFLMLNPIPCCSHKDVTYRLWPESAYYEFIPWEDQSGQSESLKVLEACEPEVGQDYEILLTTPSSMFFPMGAFAN
jgi:hypothetical protein